MPDPPCQAKPGEGRYPSLGLFRPDGVVLSVGIVVVLIMNGETNWFEGALLLAVYAVLAIEFFFLPAARAP